MSFTTILGREQRSEAYVFSTEVANGNRPELGIPYS
jgi:hypothetical protein